MPYSEHSAEHRAIALRIDQLLRYMYDRGGQEQTEHLEAVLLEYITIIVGNIC